jgi:hypothetical protein
LPAIAPAANAGCAGEGEATAATAGEADGAAGEAAGDAAAGGTVAGPTDATGWMAGLVVGPLVGLTVTVIVEGGGPD